MTKENEMLRNELCVISFKEEKEISGRDYTDQNNQPAFYNTTRRGIKKAWKYLSEEFTEKTTMYDAMNILGEYKIGTHSWCMMD